MKIFNEEEVEKAALEIYSYLPDWACKYKDELTGEFKSGVEYAESKIEDLCIGFADWVYDYASRLEYNLENNILTNKELFQEFLKERNGK